MSKAQDGETFRFNQLTTLRDWEYFLLNKLQIKRQDPKTINLNAPPNTTKTEIRKTQRKFEQAMWDKFLCESFDAFITQKLARNNDFKRLYTLENTGLMETLKRVKNERPLIIVPKSNLRIEH